MLEVCLRPNFGGIERVRLYSETFYGTKALIEGACPAIGAAYRLSPADSPPSSDYVKEVAAALKAVRESTELSLEDKRRFYKSCNKVRMGKADR